MKTLATTLTLILLISLNTFGQNTLLKTNEIAVTVEVEDGITTVIWESKREVNTSYFVVEKSISGMDFVAVETVRASGSTHQSETYSYEDLDSDTTVAQYRITLVCMDGTRYAVQTSTYATQGLAEVTVD
jgi:hypothetical protein